MEHHVAALAYAFVPMIFAITVHEAAHGYVARHFGDDTAYLAGRVSLNPLRHIDPVGTILIPALTFLTAGVAFGYAKPVPVNFGNLHHPRRDMRWVALAGPAANLAMAFIWMCVLAAVMSGHQAQGFVASMAQAGIAINVGLMVLNLIPIPPLDGGRVAVSLLPLEAARRYSRIEPYGIFIVFFVIWQFRDLLIVPASIVIAVLRQLVNFLSNLV